MQVAVFASFHACGDRAVRLKAIRWYRQVRRIPYVGDSYYHTKVDDNVAGKLVLSSSDGQRYAYTASSGCGSR